MPATSREKSDLLIVISVAFSVFMCLLSSYIVNVSLPTIADYFNVGTAEVSRVVLSYLLIITSSLLLFGRLSDRVGLKRVFVTGYIVFSAGSLLCGMSSSITMLIGFRLLQGIGTAMLLASGYAIIAKFLPPDRTGWAFGITSTCAALGVATGAPLGGLLTGYLSWHWIFFVNVPVGIVAITISCRSIPGEVDRETLTKKNGAPFDILGALLIFFGLAFLVYGFSVARTTGWTSLVALIIFAAAIVLLSLFVVREMNCKSPLLDFGPFRNVSFTYALCASFLAYMLLTGNIFLIPFYLQVIKGLSVQETGIVLFAYSLVYVLLSPYAGRLSDRVSPRRLCSVSMISASVSVFFFACMLDVGGLVPIFIFLAWFGFSYAFFLPSNTNRIMGSASSGREGPASALFNTTTYLGMIFGVALFEAVFSMPFAEHMQKGVSLLRAGTPRMFLLEGFSNAYILGGLVSLVAFLFSLAGGSDRRNKGIALLSR